MPQPVCGDRGEFSEAHQLWWAALAEQPNNTNSANSMLQKAARAFSDGGNEICARIVNANAERLMTTDLDTLNQSVSALTSMLAPGSPLSEEEKARVIAEYMKTAYSISENYPNHGFARLLERKSIFDEAFSTFVDLGDEDGAAQLLMTAHGYELERGAYSLDDALNGLLEVESTGLKMSWFTEITFQSRVFKYASALGNFDVAERASKRIVELAENYGAPRVRAIAYTYRAQHYLATEELKGAEANRLEACRALSNISNDALKARLDSTVQQLVAPMCIESIDTPLSTDMSLEELVGEEHRICRQECDSMRPALPFAQSAADCSHCNSISNSMDRTACTSQCVYDGTMPDLVAGVEASNSCESRCLNLVLDAIDQIQGNK